MQDTDSLDEQGVGEDRRKSIFRRFFFVYLLLLILLLVALAVPLININRYQRKIAASISESLGRPIHLDRISLTLLPLPGLTIENLVVGEDPAFGAEPFIRAGSVRATLRLSSLWRRKIEFTTISFDDPSINLVEKRGGRWNLASIFLQAARMNAAPTAQPRAGSVPRFPYIEASGARINLKQNLEKMPVSFVDADLSLWLSSPQTWNLRLKTRPTRTDRNVSETGTIQLEGTIGRATSLADIPLDLQGSWEGLPLGEATRMFLGHDAGWRGQADVSTTIQGMVGHNTIETTLQLSSIRRADFVPPHTEFFSARCIAHASDFFHAFTGIQCNSPSTLSPANKDRLLTASIPDTRNLSSAALEIRTPPIAAATILDWLHVATPHISSDLGATGTLAGDLRYRAPSPHNKPVWTGQITWSHGNLVIPSIARQPIFSGALTVASQEISRGNPSVAPAFTFSPVRLSLGSQEELSLDGRFDRTGCNLHLTGTASPAKLLALESALPPVGEGLAAVLPQVKDMTTVHVDLLSSRPWGGPQRWRSEPKHASASPHRRSHHSR